MATEQVNIIDAEFQNTGDDKIDFKSILFKQIDYIRFLRTQDMGEFALIDIEAIRNEALKDETTATWLRNSSVYQNAVKSLQNMLITYEDIEYNKNLKAINIKFDEKLIAGQTAVRNRYKNLKTITNNQVANRDKELSYIKKMYAIIQIPKKYDMLFRECLLLMGRAKFIGSNEIKSEKN